MFGDKGCWSVENHHILGPMDEKTGDLFTTSSHYQNEFLNFQIATFVLGLLQHITQE